MRAIQFFYSFRVRLMLVLAALLITTLSVQYFLNLSSDNHNARVVAEQEQALAAGVELGVRGITSTDRLSELLEHGNYPILSATARRVRNILVIDEQWRVYDSLLPEFQPVSQDDQTVYTQLKDVPLPQLITSGEYMDDLLSQIQQTPAPVNQVRASAPRTFPFPVDTNHGRWYVIVVLGSPNQPSGIWNIDVARPLLYMMAVLLGATLVTTVLVWQFTRPIRELSGAARRVAKGDFNFRVPSATRRDEMGELAEVFNEMIAGLGRTRELEVQLHQAEQSAVVGRLASAIAHEIRNPLNYINLTLDHLRNAFAPEDPEKRATFERLALQLKAEVARINTRISEFLSYTRPAKLELSPTDVKCQIEDALRMVEVDAVEHGVKTEIVQNGASPVIMADAKALRSVFTNLIINSLHAIDEGGGKLTITISSLSKTHSVQIDVSDTGRGINPDDLPKVFEPYFSTKETGTGLGLAIVKKVVDDHGGAISVISTPSEGTTFTITLPSNRKENEQAQRPSFAASNPSALSENGS